MADNYKFNFSKKKGQQSLVNENFVDEQASGQNIAVEEGDVFDTAPAKKVSKFKAMMPKKTKADNSDSEDFSLKFKRFSSKLKRKQIAFTTGGFAIAFALIGFLGYNTYKGKQEAMALGTEMKLDIFNGLDEFGKEILDGDIDSLMDFAMQIIDKTLEDNNIKLSPAERSELEGKVREAIQSLIDRNILEFDENGHLTDTSKAYLVNTIVNTILNAFPQLDMESVLGNNTTLSEDYKRVLDLQGALDELSGMNSDIIAAGDQINSLLSLIYGDDYENIDVSTLKEFLDVMNTLIDMDQWKQIQQIVEGSDEYITNEELTKILQDIKAMYGDQTNYTEQFEQIRKKLELLIGGLDEGDANLGEIIDKYNQLTKLLETLETKNATLEQLLSEIEQSNITEINNLSKEFDIRVTKAVSELATSEEKTFNEFKEEYNKYVAENKVNLDDIKDSIKQLAAGTDVNLNALDSKLQEMIITTATDIKTNEKNTWDLFNSEYAEFLRQNNLTIENIRAYIGALEQATGVHFDEMNTDLINLITQTSADLKDAEDEAWEEWGNEYSEFLQQNNLTVTDIRQAIQDLDDDTLNNLNNLSADMIENIKNTAKAIKDNEDATWAQFNADYAAYIENNEHTMNAMRSSLAQQIVDVNSSLTNLINHNNEAIFNAYENFSSVTTDNYNSLSNYLSYLNSYMNKSLSHLQNDTDTRITEIQAYVDRYLREAGNTEVQTIEPDHPFTFTANGSGYELVIDGNDFPKAEDGSNKLEGAFVVDVYYADPYYNIAPSYSLDSQNGILKIQTPIAPSGSIEITSIVISRNVKTTIDWTNLDATEIITLATEIKQIVDEKDPNNTLSVVDISVNLENASKKGYNELVQVITEYLNVDISDPDFNEFDYSMNHNYEPFAIDEYTHKARSEYGQWYTEPHNMVNGVCTVCNYEQQ